VLDLKTDTGPTARHTSEIVDRLKVFEGVGWQLHATSNAAFSP